MIRYRYVHHLQPPAPFVNVTFRNPINNVELRDVPAQLDTAADRTLVPETVVQTLSLAQIGSLAIGGVGGTTQTMPSYEVLLGVHDLPLQVIKVVASTDEKWVILGRDVLNALRLLLDGPQLALEIG